jgi:Mn2+/Fe2+ NRAMP family transporter
MYFGRYPMVERSAKPLLWLLGGSLLVVAALSKPDLAATAKGLLWPTIPADQGLYSYTLLLAAVAGAGAGSVSNLKYAAFIYEKGWRQLSFLPMQRRDLAVSVTSLFAASVLIQVVAAATLKPQGVPVENPDQLAMMFGEALGYSGKLVFAVGLWAAAFTTFVGSNTGYSLMVSDIYHNALFPAAGKPGDGPSPSPGNLPAYRLSLIWFCVSPLYVLFTDWNPVWLALVAAALMMTLLPVVVLVLMRLTNDRKLLGSHANGPGRKIALTGIALTSGYLAYLNGVEFWTKLAGSP